MNDEGRPSAVAGQAAGNSAIAAAGPLPAKARQSRLARLSVNSRRMAVGGFVAGAVSVLGFSPFNLFFVPFLTLAVLFWLWRHEDSPPSAAFTGFCFGLGLFLAGVSWVYISLHDFGGMLMPVAVVAVLGFAAYLSLFPALAGWLAAKSATRAPLPFALAAAAGWTLTEWLRGWLFTGFPWLAIGYSQVPWSPLAGLAPVGGVYAISFATAFAAAVIALLPEYRRSNPLAKFVALPMLAVLLLVAASLKSIEWTQPANPPISVSLLQGNVPQELKFVPGRLAQQLQTYDELALASESRLIIMPETAFPILADDVPAALLQGLRARVEGRQGDVIYGVAEGVRDGDRVDYYNSVMSVGASPAQVYRKSHLVPFGEFVPPLFGWVLNVLHIPMSDFSRGARIQEPISAAGERLAIGVCYEDAFGEEVIRQLPQATMLVNVSNDAWFGERIAPWQHTQIAQTRALETDRYMLRATNTGVTSIIDHRGRIVVSLAQEITGALHGTAQGRSGATPYVNAGNAPIVGLCIAVLMGFWVVGRRDA